MKVIKKDRTELCNEPISFAGTKSQKAALRTIKTKLKWDLNKMYRNFTDDIIKKAKL